MKEMERKPQAGAVLISEPFMNDNHFSRCIVWLVQHSDTGSVGFKLNDPSGFVMNELMDDFPTGFEVFEGGPVNADNLFFIHRHPGIARSEEVLPGLYWSGDFDQVKLLASAGLLLPDEIRLFGGYSGWGAGQLEAEMESGSWLITAGTPALIFGEASQQWAAALRSLEADKHWMIHAPRNIQWN
ncbi:MAG: YqgE/AlgH family protein [Bacteroidia bacterium]|jgi:putative transcriptional regulator